MKGKLEDAMEEDLSVKQDDRMDNSEMLEFMCRSYSFNADLVAASIDCRWTTY